MLELTATATTATTVQIVSALDAIADAYAAGDPAHGERLLSRALDDDLPWDQVCAAAARGIARRYDEPDRV
jgi:hypothetical protein